MLRLRLDSCRRTSAVVKRHVNVEVRTAAVVKRHVSVQVRYVSVEVHQVKPG